MKIIVALKMLFILFSPHASLVEELFNLCSTIGPVCDVRERPCLKMKTWVSLVLSALAMWISFSEFLKRDILISKSFPLLFFLAALYLFVVSVIDIFQKRGK
ncbi:hypothetical protein [Sporosarcina sp. FSL K6-2383]|uniref:hypothetical protein n=1 Tax=Sporosarcina sp. FSL K6-2383 TaxID=2921556 RepID=UPI00315A3714